MDASAYRFQDRDMRNIYGIDMASKHDYFAVTLNQIPPYNPSMPYVPRLKTVRQYTKQSYTDSFEMLRDEMFSRWPPYYIVADYTNEKTFTDFLIKKFGKNRVEPINFSITSKRMLKDDGLSIMRQGYKFPNPAQIKNVTLAAWVKELIAQLLREQVIITAANNVTFDHPQGEHNDLATSWELSIHGCLRWAIMPMGNPIIKRSHGKVKTNPVRNPRHYLNELTTNSNIKIKSISVSGMPQSGYVKKI
jgi:hypothetical protein